MVNGVTVVCGLITAVGSTSNFLTNKNSFMSLKIDRVQLEILVKQDEARNKMLELEQSMKRAQTELKNIKKQFGENSEEYKAQEAVVKQLRKQYDDLFEGIGIGKLTLKELGNRQRELNAILRNLDPSLPEWKQYNEQLKQVNARIAELKGKARETGLSLSKLSDGFNRYAGMAAAAVASLTGVTLTAKKCVDEFAEMEEAMSQVRKYTGMTTEEVEDLNEEFKRMDTRTAREKLNALAGDAGRLGITGKDGIMEFVDAANIINVALGEDLGDDAVKNIGKLAQMFGEDEYMGLRGAMLASASAVNEVAQSSSAAESFLVDFTARVAGVSHQAGISQANIIGFAAAMDENMLRNETSATAYQKIIMKMFTDTDKFAKAAGLDVQEFANLVRTDANEAVLRFAQALSQKGGLADLAPIFGDLQTEGAGVASVLSVMAGKADEIRSRQKLANDAYREGTSVIKEYGVQNSTVQAGLDKRKKQFQDMRIELGEKLLPSMKYMISTGRVTVDMLATMASFAMRFSGEIASLAVGIAVYTATMKAATLAMKAYEAATAAAKMGMLALDKVTKKNIFGLIAAGIASVISYFVWFRNEVDETNTSMDSLAQKAEETKAKLDRVAEVQDKLNNQDLLGDGQKKRLRSDVEAAIADLDDVITASMLATRQWYQQQREQLMKEAGDNEVLQKSYLNGLEHDLQERTKKIEEYIEQKKKLEAELAKMPKTDPEFSTNVGGDDDAKKQEQLRKQQLQDRQMQMAIAYEQEKNTIKQAYIDQQLTEAQYQQQLYDAESAYLLARKALLESFGEDTSQLQGQLLDRMIDRSNKLYQEAEKAKADAEKATSESNNHRLNEQSSQGDERINAIKRAYVNGDIDSHQAMLDAITEAERENLKERIALMEEMGMDSSELQQELLDMDVEAQRNAEEEKNRIIEEKAKARQALAQYGFEHIASIAGAMTQLYTAMQDAELSKVERKYDKEIAAAKKAGKDTTKLEEQKEKEQAEIKKKYADKMFAMQVLQVTASTAVAAMEAYKAMASIPFVGPALGAAAAAAVIIAGAAQIATAKKQRDEAKGLYTGGYSEGYTASGNPREEAGVIPVHKNEFVANHEAVANPDVRQFLDVIDVAQRNGSIRMLNTPMILEQVRLKGRYDGGYSASSGTVATGASGAWSSIPEELRIQLVTLMSENNELLRAIRDKELVVDPRKVRDGIDRINSLEKNVSRG